MNVLTIRSSLLAAGLALFAAACTTVKTSEQIDNAAVDVPAPGQVIVGEFGYRDKDVSPEQSIVLRAQQGLHHASPENPQEQAGMAVAQTLQACLVQDLRQQLNGNSMTISAAIPSAPLVPGTVVVEGELLTRTSNGFKRLVSGLGLGNPTVVTRTCVFYIGADLKPLLLASFQTASDTQVAASGDGTLAITRQSAQSNAVLTSEQVAKKIREVFFTRGWVTPQK